MTTRTREQAVIFRHPFTLGAEESYPAGSYRVLTDEAPIEGLSFLAYRRTSTMMFVPGRDGGSSIELITIDPGELAAAQRRDALGPPR
jgi:hypothetical protein